MSEDNVTPIDKHTRTEIPCDEVLDAAKKKNLDFAVVMGYTDDEEVYFACSSDDSAEILWLLEQTKLSLFASVSEDEYYDEE